MTAIHVMGRLASLLAGLLLAAVAAAGAVAAPAPEESAPTAQAERPKPPDSRRLVDLNQASREQLQVLPQVGPVVAQRILDYRKAVGPFRKVEELLNVKGIGRKTVEKATK